MFKNSVLFSAAMNLTSSKRHSSFPSDHFLNYTYSVLNIVIPFTLMISLVFKLSSNGLILFFLLAKPPLFMSDRLSLMHLSRLNQASHPFSLQLVDCEFS